MNRVNIEIKARTNKPDLIRRVLKSRNADFKGVDHQVDTYFRIPKGRLKLREGDIENYLIYYEREDECEPKESRVMLFEFDPNSNLKEILVKAFEVLIVVEKRREIYFIDNIKFHLDVVKDLGTFVEIEAISDKAEKRLYGQVREYMELFGIREEDLIAGSYSDLLLKVGLHS
jgi:predicted adenylyl cyclase CyaB